eukprot:TRINITY_DN7846_c0_g2_i1.p1 TRINITY_DN7846_c0_g2~~TRINITY_DN7846_c0_g2_i1.p1  ORF type:complete len:201 (-),score=56.39 TRINITY_DN7846_c0_g2_i1:266-868(-)
MPIIIFTTEQKQDLSFFSSIEADVVPEFAKIAVEFLKKGANKKLYAGAAQKLGVDPDAVRRALEALSSFFQESSKMLLNEIDFVDSIITLGLPKEVNEELYQMYVENRKDIRALLSESKLSLPHYQNLDWRLDVTLASRTQKQQTTPVYFLNLAIEDEGVTTTHVLQADPANLRHVCNELETALNELRTSRCQRILRNIK